MSKAYSFSSAKQVSSLSDPPTLSLARSTTPLEQKLPFWSLWYMPDCRSTSIACPPPKYGPDDAKLSSPCARLRAFPDPDLPAPRDAPRKSYTSRCAPLPPPLWSGSLPHVSSLLPGARAVSLSLAAVRTIHRLLHRCYGRDEANAHAEGCILPDALKLCAPRQSDIRGSCRGWNGSADNPGAFLGPGHVLRCLHAPYLVFSSPSLSTQSVVDNAPRAHRLP